MEEKNKKLDNIKYLCNTVIERRQMPDIEIYKIEDDVPLPEPIPERNPAPLNKLKVKESLLFPAEERSKVQQMASRLKKEKGKEFTVRVVPGEGNYCRVWRIK